MRIIQCISKKDDNWILINLDKGVIYDRNKAEFINVPMYVRQSVREAVDFSGLNITDQLKEELNIK